ncbi:MAG: benzoylformate decarboxylase [Steroidobacteraceae bacterium]
MMQEAEVTATSSSTVRTAVFELLRAFGINTVFGNPGSTELPMFRDFPQDFRYVLGLQESVVLGMADGFAQATRNAALVNLHSAAGVGHALGNVFTAFRNQTPLLITAGQQARSILPLEPFLYAQQATEFPRPYVKWSCEPARAEDVPAAIARAYYTSMQAPCGPTFVSIPVDDWDRPCPPFSARTVSRRTLGDPELLLRAAQALQQAEHPVLVVGAAVARDNAWQEVIALAERHQAPVWASPMSARNSFPEQHALFAGFLAADRAKVYACLAPHDFILVLGAPVFTYHVEGHGPIIANQATLVQLTDDPNMAVWTPIGTSIVTHLKLGIATLLQHSGEIRRTAAPASMPAPTLAGEQLTDAYVLQQIAALRPADSIIVEEAPSSRQAMHDYLPITQPDTFYTCASGGLGHGLPAAIGIALAHRGSKRSPRIIAVLGDGSSMYAIQGLAAAATLDVQVSFIILNNGSYEALREFGRHFAIARLPGVLLPQLDFCGLAQAQGIRAIKVTHAAELDQALRTAFTQPSPMLVEVMLERAATSHE